MGQQLLLSIILQHHVRKQKLGNMKLSFKIGTNGQVKRVSGNNQFKQNKNTANRLRTFLLFDHPEIGGWHHSKMERLGGGYQSGEVVVFTPTKSVMGKAARGSGVPSPLKPVSNSRQPLASVSSSQPSPHQGGPSPRHASSVLQSKRLKRSLNSDSRASP